MSARDAFLAGVRSATALQLGMLPWGVVTGVAMVSAGFTAVEAVGMSVLVFAGSAQLAILPLVAVGAPLWVMFATALMVNLRYIIYSAVLAPHFGHLPRAWRVLLSYLIVDGMFALFVGRYQAAPDDPHKHWFFFGGSALLWVGWQIATCVGIFGGALIPREWSLEFAGTLALIGLLIPLLYDRAVVGGALAAGSVALAARALPLNLGILAAVASGVAVGLAIARLVPAGATGRESRGR